VIARDERVASGMREMLAARDARLRAGERQIGWKLGFGAPAALEALSIDRPLVGFLTDGGLLDDGATVPVGAWTGPVLEPEIGAHLARDVAPGASWADVHDAIAGLSAVIELADVDGPRDDVRAILASNIFHRHVILGPVQAGRATAAGIDGRVLRDGEEIAVAPDPSALTGELVEIVRLTAELLGAHGERLSAGEVVITGSIVPGQRIAPGQRLEVELGPLGALSVAIA
jgi:2-keto-4-pentenoate hydratase